jgi:hypothetical protein
VERRLPAHPLIELVLGLGFTQGERIAFVLLPGRTAGGRGDVRCLCGLAEYARMRVIDPLSVKGDQSHRLPTAGAPQREDFVNAGE